METIAKIIAIASLLYAAAQVKNGWSFAALILGIALWAFTALFPGSNPLHELLHRGDEAVRIERVLAEAVGLVAREHE